MTLVNDGWYPLTLRSKHDSLLVIEGLIPNIYMKLNAYEMPLANIGIEKL